MYLSWTDPNKMNLTFLLGFSVAAAVKIDSTAAEEPSAKGTVSDVIWDVNPGRILKAKM